MILSQSIKVFYLITIVLFAFSSTVSAKKISKSMQHLIKLFELNEAGVAYLKHCSDYKKQITTNPFYMANAQIIFVTLTEMMVEDGPEGATTEMAQQRLMALRKPLVAKLDTLYKENGCNTKQALAAKGYFETMSKTHPERTMTSINKMNGKLK